MTLDVRLNNQSLRELMSGPPRITDQLDAACRTLEIPAKSAAELENYMGQPVELWYGGKRWFVGFLMRRRFGADGAITYVAYDPLYFLKRNTDDWYFTDSTATQAFKILADKSGVRVGPLAGTSVVFPQLYYQGASADKVAVDLLARTLRSGGKKYWFRYRPDDGADGLILFEKVVPSKIWAFQVGVNLTAASKEESLEETATVVRLINRETGKTVTKADATALKQYGQLVHFAEVDKDKADTMETDAQTLLDNLKRLGVTMAAEGINPDQAIPQLYSGDAIYVEEPVTGLVGGYYIRNLTQTFESDNLVTLSFDLTTAPDVPDLVYEDADKNPESDAKAAGTKTGAAGTTAADGVGVQQGYSDEVKALIDKYGI